MAFRRRAAHFPPSARAGRSAPAPWLSPRAGPRRVDTFGDRGRDLSPRDRFVAVRQRHFTYGMIPLRRGVAIYAHKSSSRPSSKSASARSSGYLPGRTSSAGYCCASSASAGCTTRSRPSPTQSSISGTTARSVPRPLPATGGISFRRRAPRSRLPASCPNTARNSINHCATQQIALRSRIVSIPS
jgi:hypothetical protein